MQNQKPVFDNNQVTTLFESFTKALEEIEPVQPDYIFRAKSKTECAHQFLSDLREQIIAHDFANATDEIHFFKVLKPLFSSQLIYHSGIYELELRRPQGSLARIEDFYMEEYDRINLFFGLHHDFYKYYRSGSDLLDHLYFSRKTPAHTHSFYAEIDPLFSTGYDQLIARFRANDMLSDYITRRIDELHHKPADRTSENLAAEYTWTAPLVALVELIVALDAHAALNNTPIGIGKLAHYFSRLFNIKIVNIHKIYEEIRIRKKNRTVFLDALKLSLQRKMDYDDEYAN